MAKKLEGDGPIDLTKAEATELRCALRAVFKKRDNQLQGLNTMMALALYRKRLQVVHRDHDDGSISFDLEPAPPDPAGRRPGDRQLRGRCDHHRGDSGAHAGAATCRPVS